MNLAFLWEAHTATVALSTLPTATNLRQTQHETKFFKGFFSLEPNEESEKPPATLTCPLILSSTLILSLFYHSHSLFFLFLIWSFELSGWNLYVSLWFPLWSFAKWLWTMTRQPVMNQRVNQKTKPGIESSSLETFIQNCWEDQSLLRIYIQYLKVFWR